MPTPHRGSTITKTSSSGTIGRPIYRPRRTGKSWITKSCIQRTTTRRSTLGSYQYRLTRIGPSTEGPVENALLAKTVRLKHRVPPPRTPSRLCQMACLPTLELFGLPIKPNCGRSAQALIVLPHILIYNACRYFPFHIPRHHQRTTIPPPRHAGRG